MKKLILSVAVLAVAASCSQNEVSDISVTSATSPISFSTLNDRVVTKAANDDSNDFLVLGRMTSDGATDAATVSGWYMQDVFGITTTGGSSTTSLSSTTHYWPADTSETLDFLAISPTPFDINENQDSRFVGATATAMDNIEDWDNYNSGEVIFTFQSADGQTDLTAATRQAVTQTTNAINLGFSHLLAKIIINVILYQPEDDYTYPSLTGYTINNEFPTAEDYDSDGELTATYLQTTFTAHTQRGIYYLNMDGDSTIESFDTDGDGVEETDTDARSLPGLGFYTHPANPTAKQMDPLYSAQDVNIVPQSAVGCEIDLSDMIVLTSGGSEFFAQDAGGFMTYTIQEGDIYTNGDEEADYFHPGYVYVINLVLDASSFDASTITFSATCTGWINAESEEEGDLETPLDDVYYSGDPTEEDTTEA